MLISFIIPVYNVERHLPDCLDSILCQGIESDNYEIILVEDKSTDSSLQICRDYCARYSNITLIENEKNIGPGLSRNKGIDASRGEYLHFVDSDDALYPNSLRELLSLNITSGSPDVIRFLSSVESNRDNSQNKILFKGKFLDHDTQEPYLSAWRFWFRRQYVIDNNIYFTNKKTGQDTVFTFSILSNNPYIIITSELVYIYRHNRESVSNNEDINYINCLWEVIEEIKKISAPHNLSAFYITEVYKDVLGRFYRCRRTLQECVSFKRKLRQYEQYDTIIKNGCWYIQLSRMPLLLYLYLLIKK